MDADRFDALARAVSSRRAALRRLGALGATGLLANLGRGDASAAHGACRHAGEGCKRNGQCCSRRCSPKTGKCLCTKAAQCPPTGTPCKKRVCRPNGTCGKANTTAPCALPNAEGICAGGACTVKACAASFGNCDGQHANGCETDLSTSEQHCGACNDPCGPNQTCVDRVCTGGTQCPACSGDKVCNETTGGFCRCPTERPVQCEFNSTRCSADPDTDPTRCGLNCFDCAASFAPGYRCCGGRCVNGCGPNTNGSCLEDPCGASCQPCTDGKVCCNLGPGTTGQCVDLSPSGHCPPP